MHCLPRAEKPPGPNRLPRRAAGWADLPQHQGTGVCQEAARRWQVPGQEAGLAAVSQSYLGRQRELAAPITQPGPPHVSAHLWDRWCPVFRCAGSEWQTALSSTSVLISRTSIDQPGDI